MATDSQKNKRIVDLENRLLSCRIRCQAAERLGNCLVVAAHEHAGSEDFDPDSPLGVAIARWHLFALKDDDNKEQE